ncbi:MAG: RNA-directed DNA polymerase [Atopobiaceae bacterium]|nr:RNA-directed DNA polymerase [Atopobiaceae bacterium]
MTPYESMVSFEHLYAAYRAAVRGKHAREEAIQFELDLAANLWRLHEELISKTYSVSPYHTFTVYDPKCRTIQALAFRDRVVQHSLCDNVLAPFFDNRLVYDCAACRPHKGTSFAIQRLKGFLREHHREHGVEGWALKIDVRKYFDSIDHEVLKRRLLHFPDDEMRGFLFDVIDSHNAEVGQGLPLGNQSSQWFALYYLDPLDRLFKERFRVRHYTRYMDDMVLVHPSRGYLASCLDEARAFARDELKLEFNQKTQLAPLAQGVDYLGWHFYLAETGKVIQRLRPSSKRRLKRHLRKLDRQLAAGEVDPEYMRLALAGIEGHLKQGHTGALRQRLLG